VSRATVVQALAGPRRQIGAVDQFQPDRTTTARRKAVYSCLPLDATSPESTLSHYRPTPFILTNRSEVLVCGRWWRSFWPSMLATLPGPHRRVPAQLPSLAMLSGSLSRGVTGWTVTAQQWVEDRCRRPASGDGTGSSHDKAAGGIAQHDINWSRRTLLLATHLQSVTRWSGQPVQCKRGIWSRLNFALCKMKTVEAPLLHSSQ